VHSALTHYTLPEMLDVFNLCAVIELSVTPTTSSSVVPYIASSLPHHAQEHLTPTGIVLWPVVCTLCCPNKIFLFSKVLLRTLGPTQHPIWWVPVLKCPGCEIEKSSKSQMSRTIPPLPHLTSWHAQGEFLPVPSQYNCSDNCNNVLFTVSAAVLTVWVHIPQYLKLRMIWQRVTIIQRIARFQREIQIELKKEAV